MGIRALSTLAVGSIIAISNVQADEVTGSPAAESQTTETQPTDVAVPGTQDAQTPAPAPQILDTIAVAPTEEPAPNPEAPEDAARPQNALLDEIVVTAQKREENSQSVPISIKAFSEEQLQLLGVQDTKQLSKVTPGLQFTDLVGFTIIYLRGIGTNSFVPYADPSVATYVDGLYIPAQQGNSTSLAGIERVEVLKGPQGTLFGRNSTGGAINIITKTPGDTTEATASAEYGNLDTYTFKAFVSTPVTETIGMTLSGIFNHQDPYYEQVTDDLSPLESPPANKLPDTRTYGGRAKVRWTPIDALELNVAGQLFDDRGTGSTITQLIHPSLLATAQGIGPDDEDYKFHRDTSTLLHVTNHGLSGNAVWHAGPLDMKLIGGQQKIMTADAAYDFDSSAKNLVSFYTKNSFTKLTTGEFQFLSNDEGWQADRFKWIAGLYYFHSTGGYDPLVFNVAGGTPPLITAGLTAEQLAQILATLDNAAQIPGVILDPGVGVQAAVQGVLRTDSKSVFLQGSWKFTDLLELTLGGRYQKESRFLTKQQTNAIDSNGNQYPAIVFNAPEKKEHNFSPKASLNLTLLDDLLLYLSWSKGFKSGTYNGLNIYSPPAYVVPERVETYEVGLKSEFMDGSLRFNAAIFTTDIQNPQVAFVSLASGGVVSFENAGNARVRGAEFDTIWLPMPDANPGLSILASGTYLDTKFTDYQHGNGFDEDTGLFFDDRDFTGNRLPRTPTKSGTVGLNQSVDVGRGEIEVGTDAYYNSGFYVDGQNAENSKQDAYWLLNAHASYTYRPWGVQFTVFGNNLNKEVYAIGLFTTDYGATQTLAPPRTYGMRVRWDF